MDDVWEIALNNGMEVLDPSESSVSVLLKLNSRCNSKCKYCLSWKTKPNNISYDYAKKIVENLKTFKASRITLSGGEPTLHPDFTDIVRYINKSKIKTNLITNGQFNDFEYWWEYLNEITFSIDTIDKNNYKYLRGVDVLDMVMMNLEKTIKSNILTNINIVLTKQTIQDLDVTINSFLEMGVNKIFLLDLETHLEINNSIIPNVKNSKKVIENVIAKYPAHVIYNNKLYGKELDFNCLIPWMHLTIRPNGTIYPCCRLGDDVPGEEINSFCLGNIKESNLNEIWLSHLRKEILNKISNKVPKTCLLCSIIKYFNDKDIKNKIEWVRM